MSTTLHYTTAQHYHKLCNTRQSYYYYWYMLISHTDITVSDTTALLSVIVESHIKLLTTSMLY
jgi:hypothetical protein